VNRTHKGHEITIESVEVDLDEWDLNIAVTWLEDEINRQRTFAITQIYKSYDDAVAHGLVWIKDWIDMGKPEFAVK